MSEKGLAVIETTDVPALFKEGGCDPILQKIKDEVSKFEPDTSTATGRKEIASLAHKVAKSKTYIDGVGKDLGNDYKVKLDSINSERKKVRDTLDELKEEVRKPLTEWEEIEKQRISDIQARIRSFEEYLEIEHINSEDIANTLKNIKDVFTIDDSFEEFAVEASKAKDFIVTQLEAKFIVVKNEEKEKAEAKAKEERLEKERLETERKAQEKREEEIAEKAAKQATKNAEEKARIQAEEKEAEEQAEKDRLERETLEAKLAKETAEKDKLIADEKAKQDLIDAEEKAIKEKEEAVKAETKRLAEIQKSKEEKKHLEEKEEKEAEEARQADETHRDKIINEIKEDLVETTNLKNDDISELLSVLLRNHIRHVTINF